MDKLKARGIDSVALDNEWRPGPWTRHNDDGSTTTFDGWYAPLFDSMGKRLVNHEKGKPVLTWKNADSSADPHDTWINYIQGYKPLMLPKRGIQDSVKRANGTLNMVEGKADTLSMWSAKIGNCIGIFGASFVPGDLLTQFRQWGVDLLRVFVHPDEAGLKSAQKIADALDDHLDIHFLVLPEIDGKKFDLNDFWVRAGFDNAVFRTALQKLPEREFKPRPIPQWKPVPTVPTDIPLNRLQAYANAAFNHILSDLLTVTSARNIALNNAAFKTGTFVGSGALDNNHVENELIQAGVSIGLGHNASAATVLSGLTAGVKSPADLSQLKPRDRQTTTRVRIIDASTDGLSTENAEPDSAQAVTNITTKSALIKQRRAEMAARQATNTLPMPFQTVAQKRGFASAFKRKKVYAFIADSGAGKTSMLETLIDFYLQNGFSGVVYSPEWDGDEWVMGTIQRAGGPSYMAQVEHDSRQSSNDTEHEAEYIATVNAVLDRIDAWPGDIRFVEQAESPCAEDILAGMSAAYIDSEAKGKLLSFAAVDYAQMFLSRTGKTELEQMNRALYQFKRFCIAHDMVGLVGSQITKEAGQAKGRPSHTGMMGARSDAFNFAAFIIRERDTDDSYKPNAKLHIVKNSRGRLGKCEIYQHPVTAAWHSGVWQPEPYTNGRYIEPETEAIPF